MSINDEKKFCACTEKSFRIFMLVQKNSDNSEKKVSEYLYFVNIHMHIID